MPGSPVAMRWDVECISTGRLFWQTEDVPKEPQLASGIARAFPGGRAAHPKDQNEEENEKKIKEKLREATGKWGKIKEIILSCPPGSERLATALQLAILNTVDKRLSVGHGIYHGVWDMIFSFSVEHNPVAGSRKGVDFTFHIMRYHPRFTAIDGDGQAGGVE